MGYYDNIKALIPEELEEYPSYLLGMIDEAKKADAEVAIIAEKEAEIANLSEKIAELQKENLRLVSESTSVDDVESVEESTDDGVMDLEELVEKIQKDAIEIY